MCSTYKKETSRIIRYKVNGDTTKSKKLYIKKENCWETTKKEQEVR